MSPKLLFFLAIGAVFVDYATADIFGDLLGFDLVGALTGDVEEKKSPAAAASDSSVAAGQREEEDGDDDEDDSGSSKCSCDAPTGCDCCVDFNLTSIVDLGGPGCVKMRYVSQDAGISLNVSYGDSLLHSQVVKQNDKKGSCMNLLSEFAQICARFSTLKRTDEGFEGCLNFEPHVLGEVTAKYHIGCFTMGPNGMVQDEKLAEKFQTENPATAEDEDVGEEEDSTSILDVVNQGAEQGLAFFTNLLGIKRPIKKDKTTTEKPQDEATEAEADSEDSQEAAAEESRKYSHPRNHVVRTKVNSGFA